MLDKPIFPTPDYAPDRWRNIARTYSQADVARLSGSLPIRHTLAENGAKRLWELLHSEDFVPTLGTFTGNQAVQQVKAGLKAIYLSGWQVAADANTSGNMYPDQSLYPVDSVPSVVKRINKALQRADQIQTMEQADGVATTDLDFFVPIIADAEAGFGGALNVFELMKAMIEAGAAAVHFEDQLASEKKCGHLGGKVLVPTSQFIRTLNAARLAADVMGVPTLIMARTDAEAARLITSDIDPYDAPFVSKERTAEGFYQLKGGIDAAIARGIAYAPYADLIWCETSKPDLAEAKKFAEAVRKAHPEQMLAYNCSPSFNWAKHMDEAAMASFQREIAAMGYKYQFITLAGFHNLSLTTFELARAYKQDGMAGYSRLQQAEFAAEAHGFSAVRHQREVGTSYFDAVAMAVSEGKSATTAMGESTETAQFH
ncbi:MAG: isocitrate lyase [Devosia sp.]|jgi:isocitrate lyase|uniref:isocitrate lyase n=1 Tax=Devosia sp. XGJD_8 TaxID=3391187 RepID=UPI001D8B58EF|nr:isocitrate lyase [Alphaproteobacteria bacterium]MBU1562152.1 isocitrate lyase [Alphaproteobacteria bacterium]MBU2301853.1 isocitrate lyase [Alphaproteobacteria bacterium]MBU2368439.1 isocitrate lyase [Alphaproteobacteria bacterium]